MIHSLVTYGLVALGIAISVVLPLLRALLPKPKRPKNLEAGFSWDTAMPYVATGAFALLTAVLIVSILGDQLDTASKALLAGYAWDATLQKLTTGV